MSQKSNNSKKKQLILKKSTVTVSDSIGTSDFLPTLVTTIVLGV